MKHTTQTRLGYLALALCCFAMLGIALYLQYYRYLNPCPLCMFQRACVLGFGVFALVAAIHQGGHRLWGGLALASGLLGLAIAVRHALLQYWPPKDVVNCGAGLFQMLDTMPWGTVLVDVLKGTGECAVIDWRLLGLSMPVWVAAALLVLLVFTVILMRRKSSAVG